MAKLNIKQIQARAMDILESATGGIRWGELLKAIHGADPETPPNTIHGALQSLFSANDEIIKVARGTYQLAKYVDAQALQSLAAEQASETEGVQVETPANVKVTLIESDFYESFAQWLIDVAEEVNAAVALGGSILKGKWSTPDVIGVLKCRPQDILKFEPQIVSAEIKIDANQPVVAFGQAVAYRLFSHKSYIVVPTSTSEDDLARLKALCTLHGVGLVSFELNKTEPNYNTIVLPAQASPDMFYANQMLRRLLDADAKMFNKLF